jgi:hypothetical protein
MSEAPTIAEEHPDSDELTDEQVQEAIEATNDDADDSDPEEVT